MAVGVEVRGGLLRVVYRRVDGVEVVAMGPRGDVANVVGLLVAQLVRAGASVEEVCEAVRGVLRQI